jgi:hypothetical protein
MEYNPVTQVIIALIILLLMGYVAYNIYLIELHHMFKGNNDIRKETEIFNGIIDFNDIRELKYNTKNRAHEKYRDISPSINQQGGAEYTYNFWLYVDQGRITQLKNDSNKDILLFLKGEKQFYYNNDFNYNCMFKSTDNSKIKHPILLTKNPLVRLSADGKNLAVDYNNILSPESYQNNSKYNRCDNVDNNKPWWDRNKNMIGIYDIEFSNKWFMVTIVMKEIADNNNILTKNRAICRIYINGLLVFENKLETVYGSNQDIYSATFKNNNSPLYINPIFNMKYEATSAGRKTSGDAMNIIEKNLPYLDMNLIKYDEKYNNENPNDISGIIKMGDLKYYNYALEADAINQLFRNGLKNVKLDVNKDVKYTNLNMLSAYELEKNEIKEL